MSLFEPLQFFLSFMIMLLILFHSTFSLIVTDPGLVDSPPISIIDAHFLTFDLHDLRLFVYLKIIHRLKNYLGLR